MTILVINPGTSSIKIARYSIEHGTAVEISRKNLSCTADSYDVTLVNELSNIDFADITVGIRVVHGGWKYSHPTEITDDVLSYLESIQSLAPLHNPLAIQTIRILKSRTTTSHIFAVFDTAFHANMPDKAKYYAISKRLSETHHIQRYGFHGLAHKSMVANYSQHTGIAIPDVTIITVQLGSGCSMAAIRNGTSIDTTMGFSPLEGLISRTRSGDIDPTILTYLAEKTRSTPEQILSILNTSSGLAGLSDTDGDIRSITAADAIAMFVYRIQKYLGAYDAVLNNANAFVFGGGIAEHSLSILRSIFDNPYFRVEIAANAIADELPIQQLSSSHSRPVYVVRVDEELQIANEIICALTEKE